MQRLLAVFKGKRSRSRRYRASRPAYRCRKPNDVERRSKCAGCAGGSVQTPWGDRPAYFCASFLRSTKTQRRG